MIEPVKLTLSATAEQELKTYLRKAVRSSKEGLRELHEDKLVRWRKAYEAQPAEPTREFPFHGASNLVVPIIAIHSDTLLARVMAAIFKTQPLWVLRCLGTQSEKYADCRGALETFFGYVGIEPEELDLMRVYQEWCGETIRLGTSVVKSPIVKQVEDTVIAGDTPGSYDSFPEIKYHGPRPEKLPFQDFLISPTAKTVESARFKAHINHLQRFDLEERAFRRDYDPAKVKEILKQPDRLSPHSIQQHQMSDAGARTVAGYDFAEWDIYECHFKYRVPRIGYTKLMVWYHERTDTILRAYYYYYPCEIFVAARLFYRDDFFFGYGFAEMLENFQEEISQIHNQRRDAQTVANAKVWRADPDSPLHKGYKIFPSAILPAGKDELEAVSHGEPSSVNIDEEKLALELAEKRSGVSPPMQGYGAGTNTKRGVYSAAGTLSLLQEGNTRTDLNVTDMRYAHSKLGRILMREYAEIGVETKAMMFGETGKQVIEALELFKQGRIALPISAATGSVNREVEKQNDLMLTGITQKHHSMVMELLQASANMMMPPNAKDYANKAIKSSEILMKYVMKHFGYDEVDRLVPTAQEASAAVQPQPNSIPGQAGQGGAPPTNRLNVVTPSPMPVGMKQ